MSDANGQNGAEHRTVRRRIPGGGETLERTQLDMYLETDATRRIPRLLSVEEAAADTGVSPARLIELADAQYIPHARVDGGPPLFFKADLRAWIRDHLFEVVPGRPLDERLVVWAPLPEEEQAATVPAALQEYRGRLLIERPAAPRCAVYFLMRDGCVLYVGQTVNLTMRLLDHIRGGKLFDYALYLLCPRDELLTLERQFIRALRPPLNGVRDSGALTGGTEPSELPRETTD